MVDERKLLNAIRLILAKQKDRTDIVHLLEGAYCSLESSSSFSRKRWDHMYTTLHLHVQWQYVEEFSDAIKEVLLEVADLAMPKHEMKDIMEIEVSANLETVPDIDAQTTMLITGGLLDPIFGSPSSEDVFKCDVFMVMPFESEFDPLYKRIVKPTVEQLGLKVKRGDDPFSKHEIMYEIWSMLNACSLVIADCTGRNPNVFYELGIAHTLGKPVIMLTQNLKDLPFDVNSRRAIEYDTAFHRIDELKQRLRKAIRDIAGLPREDDPLPF